MRLLLAEGTKTGERPACLPTLVESADARPRA